MQLLTTTFNKTPQFTTWQLKLICAARRLHPRRSEEFTNTDFLNMVELSNVFFALYKVKQPAFHEFADKLNERWKKNGRFTATPVEAAMLAAWVVEVSDIVGTYSWAAFTRATNDHSQYTDDFKKRNGVKKSKKRR